MRSWWRRRSIRLRLTLWYAGTLLILLMLYGAVVLVFVYQSLSRDLNRKLREDLEIAEAMLERTETGSIRLRTPGKEERRELEARVRAEVWSLDGELLYRSAALRPIADALPRPEPGGGSAIRAVSLGDDRSVRLLKGEHRIEGKPAVLRVLRQEDGMHQTVARLALIEFLALPLGTAIAGVGGYWMARRALSPVARMTERARRITADRLDERLPVANPDDELGRLAAVFNEAVARLEHAFERLRRFSADASHELRTPLTSLRSVGELALRDPQTPESSREAIQSMLEEVDRLSHLVDSLLILSRADRGELPLKHEAVDLGRLCAEAAEDLGVIAEQREQRIAVEAEERVEVEADRALLRQALLNLLDNALKHSPAKAEIRLVARQQSDGGVIEVIDRGLGIEPEHQRHVFARFYRVDRARSRERGGAGLGLSIAQWLVHAHGGAIELDSEPGTGSTFRVILPLNPVSMEVTHDASTDAERV